MGLESGRLEMNLFSESSRSLDGVGTYDLKHIRYLSCTDIRAVSATTSAVTTSAGVTADTANTGRSPVHYHYCKIKQSRGQQRIQTQGERESKRQTEWRESR